jgi:pimeloyl-ACP methyl ester carboxylesterase
MTGSRTPVVFIHGLWLHATSWGPWLDLYREAGYEPIAPGWLGEPATVAEAREHPELVADKSIDDEVAYYTEIIGSLDSKPIVIGHSFGGLLAEKLFGPGCRGRRCGDRPRADQGGAAAAAGAAASSASPAG